MTISEQRPPGRGDPPFGTPRGSGGAPPVILVSAQNGGPSNAPEGKKKAGSPPPSTVSAGSAAGPYLGPSPWRDWRNALLRYAPSWLASAVFHASLLIALALWLVTREETGTLELEAALTERLGDQLKDEAVEIGALDQTESPDRPLITPHELPPVDDPFAAPLPLQERKPGATEVFSDITAPVIGYALSGRETGMKETLTAAYGGNATTEAAVVAGLEWLARNQKRDGSWSLTGPYSGGAVQDSPQAATAMALLAFQGHGDTPRQGRFAKNVERGWRWLLKRQEKDGDFCGNIVAQARLYSQALCTIALCELYGMTGGSEYREPAGRAVNYAVKIQDRLGGWRYHPGRDSDLSVTGWFVMALQSARMAKLDVPEETLAGVVRFLNAVQEDDGREYNYHIGAFSTPAVTAEGLLCRQFLGWKQNDPRLVEGVERLLEKPIDYSGRYRDVYYWYYATQACHHMENVEGRQIWKRWNEAMRAEIPAHQVKGGGERGSWDPAGDKWGAQGGRLYTTCLSIYMLEVYYRHLPIYSGHRFLPRE